ncbi:MAG: cell division protein SepF [Oscillospiraceae bacterium]|jgi:cell division inhibitor SepF|nr:cell division protein SepF [Oscillospiraceae bacterium]
MPKIMEKIREIWTPPEDEYEDDEDTQGSACTNGARRVTSGGEDEDKNQKESKVVNIHTTAQLQVVLFKPERFGEETRVAADELIKMHTVVLNLENTARDISRRILDFLSGVAYANNGKIKKIATGTFIITPYNVDLTGDDLLDELESNGVCF